MSSMVPPMFSRLNQLDSLDVQQQPIRARMCGFGDKVRLLVSHNFVNSSHNYVIGPSPNYTSSVCSSRHHRQRDGKGGRLQVCRS